MAYIEVQFYLFGIYILEQCRNVFGCHQLAFYLERNRINTFAYKFLSLCVGFNGIGNINIQAYQPIVVSPVSTCKRVSARLLVVASGRQVLFAVERVDVEPFGCSPNHFLVIVGSFKVFYDLVLPILG